MELETQNQFEFYNEEAEKAILGTAIMNNAFLLRVSDFLEEKHFYFDEHKAIWKKFVEVARDMTANSITLQNFFQDSEILQAAGGANYLKTILTHASGVIDIRDYGRLVVELWQKREIEVLLKNSLEELKTKNFNAIAANLSNEINGLELHEPRKKTQHVAELIREMEADDAVGLSTKFVPTGFKQLDQIMSGGIHAQQLCIIGARPSVGKAQPLDSNILTLDGWKKMGEIEIGDKLASIDGKDSEVIGIFPQGEKEIFKVTFQDGRQVECCKEHLWKVYYRDWKEAKILTTERLIGMLGCVRYKRRLWIDEFQGEFGKKEVLPIDPWALGVLIGDGGLSSGAVCFTNSSKEIVDKLQDRVGNKFIVKKSGPTSQITYQIRQADQVFQKGISGVRPNQLKEKLKELKLMGCCSYEKFIPAQYLKSSKENRLELLRGLLDTDGYVGKCGQITYSTSSEKLAKDVIYLAHSLGATTYLATKIPFYNYKGQKKAGRLHYIIQISHSKGSEFLSFSKKQERTKTIKTRHKRNTFKSIESVGFKKAQCIKVSHESELYVTDNFIVTHNTTLGQNIILNVSKAGKRCLFISLEVDKRNVMYKFLSSMTSIESWKIQKRILNQGDIQALNRAKQDLREMGIYVNDSSYLKIGQIGQLIKNQIQKQPVDLVVVDYVQIIRGDDTKGKNEALIIKENTTALKAFAKQFDVAVLALAQINRKAVEGGSQEPTINDFKSSGGIEEDADVAIILHRNRSEGKKDSYFSENGKFIVAKNRHGRTGQIEINFDGNFGRFNEIGGF